MSLTNVAMVGILLSFVFLLMGVLIESQCEAETGWIKGKHPVKQGTRKRALRIGRRKAA